MDVWRKQAAPSGTKAHFPMARDGATEVALLQGTICETCSRQVTTLKGRRFPRNSVRASLTLDSGARANRSYHVQQPVISWLEIGIDDKLQPGENSTE